MPPRKRALAPTGPLTVEERIQTLEKLHRQLERSAAADFARRERELTAELEKARRRAAEAEALRDAVPLYRAASALRQALTAAEAKIAEYQSLERAIHLRAGDRLRRDLHTPAPLLRHFRTAEAAERVTRTHRQAYIAEMEPLRELSVEVDEAIEKYEAERGDGDYEDEFRRALSALGIDEWEWEHRTRWRF